MRINQGRSPRLSPSSIFCSGQPSSLSKLKSFLPVERFSSKRIERIFFFLPNSLVLTFTSRQGTCFLYYFSVLCNLLKELFLVCRRTFVLKRVQRYSKFQCEPNLSGKKFKKKTKYFGKLTQIKTKTPYTIFI